MRARKMTRRLARATRVIRVRVLEGGSAIIGGDLRYALGLRRDQRILECWGCVKCEKAAELGLSNFQRSGDPGGAAGVGLISVNRWRLFRLGRLGSGMDLIWGVSSARRKGLFCATFWGLFKNPNGFLFLALPRLWFLNHFPEKLNVQYPLEL